MNRKWSLVFVCFVEVMDAHLQNNQTAEDDILASPDRLKGKEHSLWISHLFLNILVVSCCVDFLWSRNHKGQNCWQRDILLQWPLTSVCSVVWLFVLCGHAHNTPAHQLLKCCCNTFPLDTLTQFYISIPLRAQTGSIFFYIVYIEFSVSFDHRRSVMLTVCAPWTASAAVIQTSALKLSLKPSNGPLKTWGKQTKCSDSQGLSIWLDPER